MGAALALAAWAAPAAAGQFQVEPTRLELRGSRPAQLTLSNRSRTPTRFHVEVYRWNQNAAGEMKLSPASGLVVYPSLFELPPGGRRAIRVAAAVPPRRSEQSFRIVVEELPPLRSPEQRGTGIAIRTRMSIPAFLAPQETRVAGAVGGAVREGALEAAVANRGTVHFRLASLSVRGIAADGSTRFERSEPGWYVLSGDRRRFRLTLEPDACRDSMRLLLEARTDRGTFRRELALEPAACAR